MRFAIMKYASSSYIFFAFEHLTNLFLVEHINISVSRLFLFDENGVSPLILFVTNYSGIRI